MHIRYCGVVCEAETYRALADEYFALPGDDMGPSTFNGCQEWTRATGNVKQIWIDGETGAVCKVVVNGGGGKRTFVFTNYADGAASPTLLNEWTGWECPMPVCNRPQDVVLVIDESMSISASQWQQWIAFATSVIDSYRIESDATNVGIVFFGTVARIISYLSADKDAILAALQTPQKTGASTCTGCGISVAHEYVFNNIPPNKVVLGRPANVPKLMITLTDGKVNKPGTEAQAFANLTDSANNTKNAGILSVAVGVAGYKYEDLAVIASNLPTGKAVYGVSDWAQLNTILADLVLETCSDLPA
jgi:hypothetical protein